LASFKFIVSLPNRGASRASRSSRCLFSESGRTLERFGSIIESCFAAAERVDAFYFPLFVRRFEQTAGRGASRRFGAIPFIISNFSRVDNSRDAKNLHFCDAFPRPATLFSVLFSPF
jgi:hypothetical protein